MQIEEFDQLDNVGQTSVLMNRGIHLSNRKENTHTYVLYQVDSFYVEIKYCNKRNEIEKFRSFDSSEELAVLLKNDQKI